MTPYYIPDLITRRLIELRRLADDLKMLMDSDKKKLRRIQHRIDDNGGSYYERLLAQQLVSHITWLTGQNAEIEKQMDHLLTQDQASSSAASWMLRCR